MQLGLPFAVADAAATPGPPVPDASARPGSGLPAAIGPIVFVRHRRARRYVLRVEVDGSVRVTIPRSGSRREAEAFARRHAGWISHERAARMAPPAIPLEVQRTLRERARAELPGRIRALAARHGLTVARVSVRNQRTRWGSCGRNGHICLNWRLLAMPDWVCEYVLVHELMHLRRLDHSPQYWALVAAACPGYRDARAWLRAHGRTLR
jgi:predicted metal-dependent hydrolase